MTTCQNYIKFKSDNYLRMYKTLQLFTNLFTFKTNIFTSIKIINNTNMQAKKVIKNAKLIKA